MNKIQGLCYVLHAKDYFKYQPMIDDQMSFQDQDVYVCESRYNIKTKVFKKIKSWNIPENKRVKLIQRDIPLENIRISSILVNNNLKSNRRASSSRPPCGYLIFASESRKRLIRDNPGIPFGEMSRIIGDQWRRLSPHEREKYEEKARERAREQDTQQVSNNPMTYDSPINPQRIINGGVAINGYYPNVSNVYPMNNVLPVVIKPPAAAIVNCPPRIQRVVHSEMYSKYIEHLKTDYPFISDWPKQLKASIGNNGNIPSRSLPSHWLINNSPGFYNNVYEALWSMRDNMWSDVVRVRNVLSDEW
ncbi:unnamed protein product [Rotaria sp. Silwood2]|nr:unnamed protein product [Rotaria sp. Silwood2]